MACKIIQKEKLSYTETEHIENEIKIMRSIKSENAIKLFKVMKTKLRYYLFAKCCQGCDLQELKETRGRFTEIEAKIILE